MPYITLNTTPPSPYSIDRLRRDNPQTSFPKDLPTALLNEYGVHEYTPSPAPTFDRNKEKIEQSFSEVSPGQWQEIWVVAPLTPEAIGQKLTQARETAQIDRFTFAQRVAVAGFVTFEEAAAWAAGNQIPVKVQEIIAAMPLERQGFVTLDVLASPNLRRNSPLMPPLAKAFGTDDAGLDALFGI